MEEGGGHQRTYQTQLEVTTGIFYELCGVPTPQKSSWKLMETFQFGEKWECHSEISGRPSKHRENVCNLSAPQKDSRSFFPQSGISVDRQPNPMLRAEARFSRCQNGNHRMTEHCMQPLLPTVVFLGKGYARPLPSRKSVASQWGYSFMYLLSSWYRK